MLGHDGRGTDGGNHVRRRRGVRRSGPRCSGRRMSTTMVLAAPERKRILNAILNQPQPWTTEQCRVYRELVAAEYMHEIGDSDPMDGLVDYLLQESSAKFCGHLLAQGVPLE